MDYYIQNPEIERKTILKKYKELALAIDPSTRKALKTNFFKAYSLAVKAHKDMRRKSGEPYIYHPITVAEIVLNEIGLGATSAIAALLHDVVEDTDYTLQDIHDMFGDKVATIVDGLTKIEDIAAEDSSQQAENFKKILVSMTDDPRVILIKLADRLHNMRTLDSLPSEKRLKIASETIFFFVPLAHRLGLYRIKSELEDLAMKYYDQFEYNKIASRLKESREEREQLIHDFIKPIQEKLDQLGIEVEVSSRTKSIHSIFQKMKNKGIDFEDIYDIFAVRLVFDSIPEEEKDICWKIHTAVTSLYKTNPLRERNFLTNPKSNGYQSLHVTAMSNIGKWVEVQIRSKRMDEIAEKGFAAHYKYKEENRTPEEYENRVETWFLNIREILKSEDSNAIELLDEIKMNLQLKEVIFFTPKGDRKVLPNGATVLDFAYKLHTDIGHACIGAKVNHNIVAIDHVLKNGEQVEIITSKKQFPKREWLSIAKTTHARERIKDALRKKQKETSALGIEKLKVIFENMGEEYSPANMKKAQSLLKFSSTVEFLNAIAQDKVNESKISKLFSQSMVNDEYKDFRTKITTQGERTSIDAIIDEQLEKKPEIFFLDDTTEAIQYKIATCCKAIPGDQVVGFQITNDTIEVHQTKCPKAIEQMSKFGNRIIKAKWRKDHDLAFLCGIKLQGFDRQGLLKEVIDLISSQLGLNIRSIDFSTVGNLFSGKLIFYIQNTKTLYGLIDSLNAIEEIEKTERILPDTN